MQKSSVVEVAQKFWDAQEEAHQKRTGRPSIFNGLKVVDVRYGYKESNQWLVQFSPWTPDGGVTDSPSFVIVNDDTGEAFFEHF